MNAAQLVIGAGLQLSLTIQGPETMDPLTYTAPHRIRELAPGAFVDVDELERQNASAARELERRSPAPRERTPSIEELRAYAAERIARREERRREARRRHRRELLEAAIVAAVLVLAAFVVGAWLFSTSAHAQTSTSAEELAAAAWPTARAISPPGACVDTIRVEIGERADVDARFPEYPAGSRGGYYLPAPWCLVVLARDTAIDLPGVCAMEAHELHHDAGVEHTDTPGDLMYGGLDGGIGIPPECDALAGAAAAPAAVSDPAAALLRTVLAEGRREWPGLTPACSARPGRVRCKWGRSRIYPRTVIAVDRDRDGSYDELRIDGVPNMRELRRARCRRARAAGHRRAVGRICRSERVNRR